MTTHSSILAWKFPWTPGRLKSTMTTFVFQPMIIAAVCARERGNTKLLSWDLHSSRHSFEFQAPVLYLDLFCPWLSKMCLKATASPLYAISAYRNFHRNGLLLDNAGILCIYHHNHIRQVRVKLNTKS